jgi:hypothetical protein
MRSTLNGIANSAQVIVLVIAFGLIAAFGVWFRRRRDTKRGLQMYGNPVSGAGPLQSSGILSTSGVLPSNQSLPPSQTRSLPTNSVASSRTNVAPPKSVTSGNHRLQKQSPAAAVDFRKVETQQVPPP